MPAVVEETAGPLHKHERLINRMDTGMDYSSFGLRAIFYFFLCASRTLLLSKEHTHTESENKSIPYICSVWAVFRAEK